MIIQNIKKTINKYIVNLIIIVVFFIVGVIIDAHLIDQLPISPHISIVIEVVVVVVVVIFHDDIIDFRNFRRMTTMTLRKEMRVVDSDMVEEEEEDIENSNSKFK